MLNPWSGLEFKDFFVIQIACLILFTTSNLIITQLFSPNEVTPYNLAFKYISSVHMLFVIIQTPLWSAITDAFARKDYLWIGRAISRQLRIWTLCSLGIVLLICLKSFVFHIWIGDKLEIPYSLVVILGLYHTFFMLSMDFWCICKWHRSFEGTIICSYCTKCFIYTSRDFFE